MFRLEHVIAPPPAPLSVPPGMSGTPDALEALRAGNQQQLDQFELAWLNAFGPKPEITLDMLAGDYRVEGLQPVAVAISRNAGRDGRTRIEWEMVRPCPRCWMRPSIRKDCRRCNGYGCLDDAHAWQSFYCDTDGNVVGSDAW